LTEQTQEKQGENIEGGFVNRWVFQEELFQKYLDKLDDMTWLDDEADDEIDDENIIESLPANINVEKLVKECIGHNALVSLCHSHRDLFFAKRAEYLINLLINADLITLEQVEEMKKSWDKSINDFMAEEEPCSTD